MNPFFGVSGKLKSLLDRLTSSRAAALDNLDAAISSRAPASSALSNAVWSNTRADYIDNIWSGVVSGGIPGTVKSIQRVSWSMISGSVNVTIASVNPAKSALTLLGVIVNSSNFVDALVYGDITGATTVTLTRAITSASPTTSGVIQVVEYW